VQEVTMPGPGLDLIGEEEFAERFIEAYREVVA